MNDKLRLAFIGTGSMGQNAHMKNYATLNECEIVALAEVRPRLAERVAAKYAVPRVYHDHHELLANEQVDALVAIHPFPRHVFLLPELLEAKVPIMIEKPLAATYEGGQRLVEAVKQSGTWIMLGYHKRSDPATTYAKAEIDHLKASGELGKLRYIRILMPAGDWVAGGFNDLLTSDEPFPPLEMESKPDSMDEAAFNQYTAFVNYYIHQVNLMRYLLGEPYEVTFADKSGVLMAAESASGVCCTLEMTPYRTTIAWEEEALIAFEKGYVKLSLPAPLACNRPGRVEVYRDPDGGSPVRLEPTLPWESAMHAQARNFLAAVQGVQPPLTTAEEALEDLRIALDYIRLFNSP